MKTEIARLEALLPTDNVEALRATFGGNEGEHLAELQQSLQEWNEKHRLAAFRKGGKAAWDAYQPIG